MSVSVRTDSLGNNRHCCSSASEPHRPQETELSRRHMLRAGVVGSVTGFLGGLGADLTLSHSAAAQGIVNAG